MAGLKCSRLSCNWLEQFGSLLNAVNTDRETQTVDLYFRVYKLNPRQYLTFEMIFLVNRSIRKQKVGIEIKL